MKGMLDIGLPNCVMWCAEGWTFQSLILFSGYFSVEDQAAQAACATFSTMIFMMSSGFADASSALIGNSIGDPDMRVGTAKAWRYSTLIAVTVFFYNLLALAPFTYFIDEIAEVLTGRSGVYDEVRNLLPVVLLSFFFETMQLQR